MTSAATRSSSRSGGDIPPSHGTVESDQPQGLHPAQNHAAIDRESRAWSPSSVFLRRAFLRTAPVCMLYAWLTCAKTDSAHAACMIAMEVLPEHTLLPKD